MCCYVCMHTCTKFACILLLLYFFQSLAVSQEGNNEKELFHFNKMRNGIRNNRKMRNRIKSYNLDFIKITLKLNHYFFVIRF